LPAPRRHPMATNSPESSPVRAAEHRYLQRNPVSGTNLPEPSPPSSPFASDAVLGEAIALSEGRCSTWVASDCPGGRSRRALSWFAPGPSAVTPAKAGVQAKARVVHPCFGFRRNGGERKAPGACRASLRSPGRQTGSGSLPLLAPRSPRHPRRKRGSRRRCESDGSRGKRGSQEGSWSLRCTRLRSLPSSHLVPPVTRRKPGSRRRCEADGFRGKRGSQEGSWNLRCTRLRSLPTSRLVPPVTPAKAGVQAALRVGRVSR
jgi:hypothetical protein